VLTLQAAVLSLVVLAPGPGALPPATTATELLVRGEQALADLEYDLAAEELMRAATAPDATDAQRLRAHLLAGTANRVAGKDVDAQINFRYVLSRAPETQLPANSPPKVLSFFEAVRQDLLAQNEAARQAAAQQALQAHGEPERRDGGAPADDVSPAPPSGFPLAWVVAGSGAALAVIAGGTLGAVEIYLADASAPGDARGTAQMIGMGATGVLAVGTVAAAGGGIWAALGTE
jgi:hypothetical protein